MSLEATEITSAPSQPNEAHQRLIQVLEQHPDGATNEQLSAGFGGDQVGMVDAVNALLAAHRLHLFQHGNTLLYKLVNADDAAKFSGLTSEEMLVLQQVEASGDKGIWIRNLKFATRLQQQNLTKILKRLENRKLVKAVKSVAQKNRKMYMLFDIVPSKEITGGPWYTEQELDLVFVEEIRNFVYEILRRKPCTRIELTDTIAKAGVSQVALGTAEVQQIIDTLVYDGKVERMTTAAASTITQRGSAINLPTHIADTVKYRVARTVSNYDFISNIPCGVCPVMDECHPGGIISPEACVYYSKWLDF